MDLITTNPQLPVHTLIAFLAYITAIIVRFIRCICRKFLKPCCSICPERNEDVGNIIDNNDNECNGNLNNLPTANEGIALSGNIIPNQNNNGRTGVVKGCYRRY